MSFSIEFADETQEYQARIKVVGCGGSGGNAVNAMINFGLEGVEFIAVNTDAQALNSNQAPLKIGIGGAVTKGLGAGADPEKGRKAALEDVTRIKEAIGGADMVFITAGMGGGTGTGAAPIIAQLAKEEGALTVGVVTKPFLFEGRLRARKAEHGIALLTEHVDTLITIPNEKLMTLEGCEELSFIDAFRKADEVLYQAVKGISDLITQSGIVNVDFADVKTVMSNMGRSMMGTGAAKGQGRARLAAEMAIQSPLLDNLSVEGATGVLINIVGGPDLKLKEMEEAASLIQQQAHEDANIIWGASIDEAMGEMVKVTVIATGFDREAQQIGDFAHASSSRPAPASIAYSIPSSVGSRQVAASNASSSSMRPAAASMGSRNDRDRDEQPATVHSGRRSSQPGAFAGPVQGALPMRESMREAMRDPRDRGASLLAGAVDNEWDTPTFQRKGQ